MLFAVVDIETTGGYAAGNGITEVAIAIHDGKEVLHFYETLINPGRPIPYFISGLTGITNDMVADAPAFSEVAHTIYELLQDKIFVAHNVNFDYSFLKHYLGDAGYELNVKKLCTVRLARKIVPGLRGYGLGKICHHLDIPLRNHHRAGGDTMATATLLSMLIERDANNELSAMLKGKNREQYLPPNLPVEQVDGLPSVPGVYYFYNAAGKVIYIGKAKNISRRVKSHFSNNKSNRQKQSFLKDIHRISYTACATDLMAHILESAEIRKLWPLYNRSQRGYLPKFGLYIYEDMQGYKRLAIEKSKNVYKPVYTFNTIIEGHNLLREMIAEFDLCARLCNLAPNADCAKKLVPEVCSGSCLESIESYNEKVTEAIGWLQKRLPTFAFVDNGIAAEEQSCILIKEGRFYGMGYISGKESAALKDYAKLEQYLEPYQENDYIRNLVFKHAASFPEKCIIY